MKGKDEADKSNSINSCEELLLACFSRSILKSPITKTSLLTKSILLSRVVKHDL